MADLDQLERALRNADAAGDVEAAKALAVEYGRVKQSMAAPDMAEPEAVSQPTQRKTPQRWSDVGKEAISNIPSSTANLVKGMAETVMHPIDTATALKDIAIGGAFTVLPEAIAPSATPEQKQKAKALSDFYKGRYGSMEGFKEAVAKDPVGVMSDISAVAGGVGALGVKPARIVSEVTNPVSDLLRAGKASKEFVGNRAADVLGMTTGAGGEAIRQAYGAGKAGGEKAQAFARNLRGQADIGDVVGEAQGALANMRRARGEAYRAGMEGVNQNPTPLDMDPIFSAINNSLNEVTYKGQVVNQPAYKALKKVESKIDDWAIGNLHNFRTAEGLDNLKQAIGGVLESIPMEQATARKMVGDVYHSVKKQIVEQEPAYADVMKDYEQASNLTKEIERSLSLGKKAAADTAIRKLQSLTRNNVNTNYGNRMRLAEELQQAGAPNLMSNLSGQALSSWTPRGLQAATGGGAALYGASVNPSALAALPLTSPRLAGEVAYGMGQAARMGENIPGAVSRAAESMNIDPRALANYLYQAQQPKQQ